MDSPLIRELADAIDRGEAVVMATVIGTRRSVPRRAGSRMLVYRDARTIGSIGGGEMESRVIAACVDVLHSGLPSTIDFDLVDPRNGDPGVCGGSVTLYLEPFMPTPTVLVIGCGHVGRAVTDLAHWSGFRVVAYDDRTEFVTPEALPHAHVRLTGSLDEALASNPVTADTHVVLVSRNMGVDLEVLPVVLSAPSASVGVMGSARRWETTKAALIERGMAPERLAEVRSPIGLELHAETPEEIAVSIIAELVALRRGAR